jgi:hypothetical protein
MPWAQNSFWTQPIVLSEKLKWMLHSVHLEIVLILTQDRCTVCVEHTKGSVIILYAPDELLGDMGHVESYICPFEDSVTVGAR